jgi:L-iditol 2-dehydrogenase
MKVAMLEDVGRIAIRDVNDLRPAPDEILIRTAYAGVCGSDLHAFRGKHPFRKPPVILGHELSGTIVEVGREVRGFQAGERVTVMPLLACKRCLHCQMGNENICLNKRVPGVEGWLGSFAQYFLSKPSITYKLGGKTGLDVGVLAEPLAVGVHSVFQRGRVGAGSHVLILGAGTIGILTALAARMAGAKDIVVTDLFEFNLRLASGLCGAQGYHAKTDGLEEVILKDFPCKFDVTFLCSDAPKTVSQAFLLTRRGGRIIVTGIFHGPVPTELTTVSLNEFEVVGSVVYNHHDFKKAVEWIDSGAFAFGKLITHILPIEKADSALNLLDRHKEDVAKILLEVNA